MTTLSATDKIFGTTALSEQQAALVKKTYALLSVSVVTAVAGGYYGSHSPEIVNLFFSRAGWLLAIVLLNVLPAVALWASRQSPAIGIVALALDGLVSGLTLSPILYLA